jgi:hypothetical protein
MSGSGDQKDTLAARDPGCREFRHSPAQGIVAIVEPDGVLSRSGSGIHELS